jgi:hypothetical protein
MQSGKSLVLTDHIPPSLIVAKLEADLLVLATATADASLL